MASFQARLWASHRPVFIPWPPTGLWMWPASPTRKTGPRLKAPATRWLTR